MNRLGLHWHVCAAGTGHCDDLHGYHHVAEHGDLYIDPVSSKHGHHVGWRTTFANTKGAITGGLWHSLNGHKPVSFNQAFKLARKFLEELSILERAR